MEITALVPVYGIIYCATNLINNKKYIGKTRKYLNERKEAHLKNAKNKINRYFYDAINKYGSENFKWEIIDSASTLQMLNFKEKFYIKYFNTYFKNDLKNGYNMTEGGDGGNVIGSYSIEKMIEYGNKISLANKGKKKPKEFAQNLSLNRRGKNNPMYGRKNSKLTIMKAYERFKSYKNPGKNKSKETCKKISESNKGRIPPNYIIPNKEEYLKELNLLLNNINFNLQDICLKIKAKTRFYIIINRISKDFFFTSKDRNIENINFYNLEKYKLRKNDKFIICRYNIYYKCLETNENFKYLGNFLKKYGKNNKNFNYIKIIEKDDNFK